MKTSTSSSTSELSRALEIDHALTEMEREINLLLNITPLNAAEPWVDFELEAFRRVPVFGRDVGPFDHRLRQVTVLSSG